MLKIRDEPISISHDIAINVVVHELVLHFGIEAAFSADRCPEYFPLSMFSMRFYENLQFSFRSTQETQSSW